MFEGEKQEMKLPCKSAPAEVTRDAFSVHKIILAFIRNAVNSCHPTRTLLLRKNSVSRLQNIVRTDYFM